MALGAPGEAVRVSALTWGIGAVFFAMLGATESVSAAAYIFSAVILGGITTTAVWYLIAERIMRPVSARALDGGPAGHRSGPSIQLRLAMAWTLATGTTNWNAAVTLAPGTNVISAYAVDTSSNLSLTVSQKMFYAVSAPITLNIVGKGTVSGATNGQLLVIGKSYTLTATPGAGCVLSNWLVQVNGGTVLSTNKAGPLDMASNLVLTVTFADVQLPTVTITRPSSRSVTNTHA